MTVWPINQWAREAISKADTQFNTSTGTTSNDDVVVDPNSNKDTKNQKSIFIAQEFLTLTSSSFMNDELLSKDEDRLVKVGRSLVDLVDLSDDGGADDDGADDVLKLGLQNIVEQCDILATDDLQVPKVRFGKTEIQMPIATLGCMRFQQTWAGDIDSMTKVNPAVQENIKEIFKYAISKLGMNHIETAAMYGCSEIQIGAVLQDLYKEKITSRDQLIIQTKVNPMGEKSFRETLDKSFVLLQTDYFDMLSFHGVNLDSQFDLIFNNPNEGEMNLIDVVREYQALGKIRHIGFSTHGQPELIRKCIETDVFDYCNLHYHYFGSYTASGGGVKDGNLENIRLMKEKDMGMFVISAYDKGGRLYAPSKKLRSLTLPELEPIQFGSLWLYAHEDMDEEHAPVHTFTVGAARPSDLDEPAVAAYLYRTRKDETMKKIQIVTKRLDDAKVKELGEDWVNSWFEGVPNCVKEDEVYNLAQIVSLYNQIQAWGMLDYAKDRYGVFDDNSAKWDSKLSAAENIAPMKMMWGYMPGIAPKDRSEYSDLLSQVPEKNKEKVMEAIEFVTKFCSKTSDKSSLDVPNEWETAYDMRPWCAFPERG